MKIEAGSIVILKSGGPQMTVRWVDADEAHCDWFDAKQEKGARFGVAQLELQRSAPAK